jgi:hypothetical protein
MWSEGSRTSTAEFLLAMDILEHRTRLTLAPRRLRAPGLQIAPSPAPRGQDIPAPLRLQDFRFLQIGPLSCFFTFATTFGDPATRTIIPRPI